MWPKENVAGQISELDETLLIIGNDVRIRAIVHKPIAGNGSTAIKDNLICSTAVCPSHAPGSAAFRMAGREMRRQHRTAELNRLIVADDAIYFDGRKRPNFIETIQLPAAIATRAVALACNHLCSRESLEPGEPATVIVMGVAVQQKLHIRDMKPKVGNAPFDKWRRFSETSVQQDGTAWSRDKKYGHSFNTHVIDIADYAEWLDRLIPRRPLFRAHLGNERATDDQERKHRHRSERTTGVSSHSDRNVSAGSTRVALRDGT